jgi:hypothetical protein
MSRCGQPIAPAATMISRAAATTPRRPSRSTSTPTARPSTTTTRRTCAPVQTVRLPRRRAGRR